VIINLSTFFGARLGLPFAIGSGLQSDIWVCYKQCGDKGAFFLTEPLDNHGWEWRCYMSDPDGYLIEVGHILKWPSIVSKTPVNLPNDKPVSGPEDSSAESPVARRSKNRSQAGIKKGDNGFKNSEW